MFGLPFANKAFLIQYNIDLLNKAFPNSLILHIRRDPKFIMQSIYQARKRYYGTLNEWWSLRPKEYDQLKDMDYYHQIAGQVFYTEKSLTEQLMLIDEKNKMTFSYEEFCSSPQLIADKIIEKYAQFGVNIKMDMNSSGNIKTSNDVRIDLDEMKKLEDAYDYFLNKG